MELNSFKNLKQNKAPSACAELPYINARWELLQMTQGLCCTCLTYLKCWLTPLCVNNFRLDFGDLDSFHICLGWHKVSVLRFSHACFVHVEGVGRIWIYMHACEFVRVSGDIRFSVDIILNTLVSDLGLSADAESAVIFFFFFSLQRSSEHSCICQWKHPVLEGCLLLLARDRCPGSYDRRYVFLLFSLVICRWLS